MNDLVWPKAAKLICIGLLMLSRIAAWAQSDEAALAAWKDDIKKKEQAVGKRFVKPPQGKSYEADVPDTLDLADRARLGINCLTGALDPDYGYELYFVLLLNRASPWVDLDSYLPYEGRVIITNKTARRAAVRVAVGTQRVEPLWVGNYLVLEKLLPEQKIEIAFPVVERSVAATLEGVAYRLNFRGNTLIDYSIIGTAPNSGIRGGNDYPIYQRAAMRSSQAPMVTKRR